MSAFEHRLPLCTATTRHVFGGWAQHRAPPLAELQEGSRRYALVVASRTEAVFLLAFDAGSEVPSWWRVLHTPYATGIDRGTLERVAQGVLEVVAQGFHCKDDSHLDFAGRFSDDGAPL